MSERTRSLIQFLIQEILVSSDAIALGLQACDPIDSYLPIVLWQHGLINLTELERVFDWLAASTCVVDNAHLSVGVTL